jgi:hypothetical protein
MSDVRVVFRHEVETAQLPALSGTLEVTP